MNLAINEGKAQCWWYKGRKPSLGELDGRTNEIGMEHM